MLYINVSYVYYLKQLHHHRTHANHHHAVQIVFVVSLEMVFQLAHVKLDTLEHHRTVDQNVLLVLNVINTQLVSIKDVKIHALEHVVLMLVSFLFIFYMQNLKNYNIIISYGVIQTFKKTYLFFVFLDSNFFF